MWWGLPGGFLLQHYWPSLLNVLGNMDSNFYLLDTDGHQGVQSPFQAFCQFPEGLTIIGKNLLIRGVLSWTLGQIGRQGSVRTYIPVRFSLITEPQKVRKHCRVWLCLLSRTVTRGKTGKNTVLPGFCGIKRTGSSGTPRRWCSSQCESLACQKFIMAAQLNKQSLCKSPPIHMFLIIGNDVSFDFNHCNESFCSEYLIDYKDPTTGQLAALLEAATSCEQTITFDCFLSPIKVMLIRLLK